MGMVRTRRDAIVGLSAAFAWPAAAATAPLTVYAAASLKGALDQVNAAFAAAPRGSRVIVSYAASSTLARQIERGAPADVFVSADVAWMDYLQKRRLIRPETRRDLLTNRLALIAPAGSTTVLRLRPGMPLAAALKGGRLALAGPDVPAGRYARSALAALGAWDAVKDRTALGENVRATLQYVARGEAPLGVVYDTDAMAEPRVRIVGLFPQDSHPRIVYPAAALAASRTSSAAAAYLGFLAGPRAMAIFRRHGFNPAA